MARHRVCRHSDICVKGTNAGWLDLYRLWGEDAVVDTVRWPGGKGGEVSKILR